jgi:hypothetical protein
LSEVWYVAGSGGPVVNKQTGLCLADLPLASTSPLPTTIRTVSCDPPAPFKGWIHQP